MKLGCNALKLVKVAKPAAQGVCKLNKLLLLYYLHTEDSVSRIRLCGSSQRAAPTGGYEQHTDPPGKV